MVNLNLLYVHLFLLEKSLLKEMDSISLKPSGCNGLRKTICKENHFYNICPSNLHRVTVYKAGLFAPSFAKRMGTTIESAHI